MKKLMMLSLVAMGVSNIAMADEEIFNWRIHEMMHKMDKKMNHKMMGVFEKENVGQGEIYNDPTLGQKVSFAQDYMSYLYDAS